MLGMTHRASSGAQRAAFSLREKDLTPTKGKSDGGGDRTGSVAAALLAHTFCAGSDLEPQMMRRCREGHAPAHLVLPGDHPAAQHDGVDTQAVANRLEGEGVSTRRIGHNPPFRIQVEHPLASAPGRGALLIDVDSVGQQGQHQPLLAGQPMATGKIVVLAGKNLMKSDDAIEDCIGPEL